MRFIAEVVPVAMGEYGPFAPSAAEIETALAAEEPRPSVRSYRWYELAAVDGSGSEKFTVAQDPATGLDRIESMQLFVPVHVEAEFHGDARKLRLLGVVSDAAAKGLKAA